MTAEQKTKLAKFLFTAEDFLGSGFARERDLVFADDWEPSGALEPEQQAADFSSLPLAFQVDEEDPAENSLVLVTGVDPVQDRSAEYLDRMLASAGLYNNRNCVFADNKAFNDIQYMERLIRTYNPKLILCLGKNENLRAGIPDNIPVLKTFHPEELLRDNSLRRPAFEDMKRLMAELVVLDQQYAADVKELLREYAAKDANFAARVQGYIA